MQIKLSLRVPLYSTENESKVMICIENLLGVQPELKRIDDAEITYLIAENLPIDVLKRLFNHIRQNFILDSVRQCMKRDYYSNSLVVPLHKQALFTNKIAFTTEGTSSPLGNVELIIQPDNCDKFLDWFVPKTEDGKELSPRKFSEISTL